MFLYTNGSYKPKQNLFANMFKISRLHHMNIYRSDSTIMME